jgi:hypothetical protein
MGRFVSVRGWLEVDEDQRAKVRQLVESNVQRNPYSKCWVFPDIPSGFSCFAFFGCTVRATSLDAVKEQVQAIAEGVFSIDGEFTDYVDGVFHVDGDYDDEHPVHSVWRCADGRFVEEVVA